MKIIVDTDPGFDDLIAIRYLIEYSRKNKEIEILLISSVGGNSTVNNTTKNLFYFLKKLDFDITKISKGYESEFVDRKSLIDSRKKEVNISLNSVEEILKLIKSNPHEIILICLGPLTNIYRAIKKDRDTMKMLKHVCIMGGNINVKGNAKTNEELNAFWDKEAFIEVMNLDIDKYLVPLDLCNEFGFDEDFFYGIQNKSFSEFFNRYIKKYKQAIYETQKINKVIIFDLVAVFCSLNLEKMKIKKSEMFYQIIDFDKKYFFKEIKKYLIDAE